MREYWIKWEPLNGLANKYFVEEISDNTEQLKIILVNDFKPYHKVQMLFKNFVECYRSTNESYRLKTMYALIDQYGKDFCGKWTLFKVLNSTYLQAARKENPSISNISELSHIAILAGDSLVDILTKNDPIITFLEKGPTCQNNGYTGNP